jgi:hypothetical protein
MKIKLLNEVKRLIKEGELEKCLELLAQKFPSSHEFDHQLARLNTLNKNYEKGMLNYEQFSTEKNRIQIACLDSFQRIGENIPEIHSFPIKTSQGKKIDLPDDPYIKALKPFEEGRNSDLCP